MELNITSFFELLIGNINGKKVPLFFYIIPLIAILIFFAIRDFALANKNHLKENIKPIIADFMLEVLTALMTSMTCVFLVQNFLISITLGIITSIYLLPKIKSVKKEKNEKKTEENIDDKLDVEKNVNDNKNTSDNKNINTNSVNVVINNNSEDDKDKLQDFYDPNNLRLPDSVTSFNQLNIIMILEMYGYISKNQKFKMITQSLFETPDEQVEKLLEMYVLNKDELDEARAILNLIRLNNRLVTKEEALQYILKFKEKQRKKGEDDDAESNY